MMKKVLIAFEHYRRPLLEGVFKFAQEQGWHLSLEMVNRPSAIPYGWEGDGVLAMLIHGDPELVEFLGTLAQPVINLEGRVGYPYPRVHSDSVAGAKVVVDDMMHKGYQHFVFYGPKDSVRGRDFLQLLEERKLKGHHILEIDGPWSEQCAVCQQSLSEIWDDCDGPLAVYSWTDYSAANFVNMAQTMAYRIPEDMIVIGTDDEKLVCESAAVRLSSLCTDLKGVGYLGAKQLERLMHRPQNLKDIAHPPGSIKERSSGLGLAVRSETLRLSVDYMKENFSKPINISDVVQHSELSRRSLENCFRRELGLSPRKVLENMRIQHAKIQLHMTTLKIASIGQESGYRDAHHFTKIFKQVTGYSPKAYRRMHDQDALSP